ncbi:hypothetical protein F66182_4860 [Fusarium sp. NRRL 66182]|nr:hypothetical protein F66182_4860 [Fusarium sp. NRRL 66182]
MSSVPRSARLKATDTQASATIHLAETSTLPPELIQSPMNKRYKRRAAAAPVQEQPAAKSAKKAPKSAVQKTNTKKRPTRPVSTGDVLAALPQEIFDLIVDNIKDSNTLSRLSRTCKKYHSLVKPQLYKRISVQVSFHAHIPRFIRTLEPLLTVAQRKELKKVGKYKGQREDYPKIDIHEKPEIANHVRQIFFDTGDPGQSHRQIIDRYVEETLKTLTNLEVVETRVLNESVAESLAALKSLQALHLPSVKWQKGALKPLNTIQNLKHLYLETDGFHDDADLENPLQTLIFNSRSTLRSLHLKTTFGSLYCLDNWQKMIQASGTPSNQTHHLISLKSFSLTRTSIDLTLHNALVRIIDFVGLEELSLDDLGGDTAPLFQHLGSEYSAAQGRDVKLRTLTLDMTRHDSGMSRDVKRAIFDAKYRFLSSFDALTSLELVDYSQSRAEVPQPELTDKLLEPILKHKNLTRLSFLFNELDENKIPYLSAAALAKIIATLPKLQHLQFAPKDCDIEGIAKVLARATNLRSINLFPTRHFFKLDYTQRDEKRLETLTTILQAALSRDSHSNGKDFEWEEHSKLRRVDINHHKWEVASKFGKRQKGMKKPDKFKVEGNSQREVMYRDITDSERPWLYESGFDLGFAWMNKVANDLDLDKKGFEQRNWHVYLSILAKPSLITSTPGRSAALRFAQKYPVVLLARRPESYESTLADVKKAGGRAIGISADVSDPASLKKAFEGISKELPDSKLAAAIYNAGGGFSRRPFLEATEDDLNASIDGSIRAFFHFAQATLPHLLDAVPDSPYPPTLIITGATASVRGTALFGVFAAGKWAQRALGQSLAREYGPKGVHVAHAIIDGVIDIPRTRGLSVNNGAEDGKISPDAIAESYWNLHTQHRSAFSHEIDIRPYVERF